jgi:hypothetical protein
MVEEDIVLVKDQMALEVVLPDSLLLDGWRPFGKVQAQEYGALAARVGHSLHVNGHKSFRLHSCQYRFLLCLR